MRLFLGIVLLLFCLFVGFCLSGKYYYRRVFYTDFASFNIILIQETAFKQTTLTNIIKGQNKKTDFYILLSDYLLGGKIEKENTYLTIQEKDYVYEYLKNLGMVDKDTQLEYLKGVNNYIVEKQENSILDEKKYKLLYTKLSFLIGLILLIVVL